MKILILNWRDIKNPSSGGAEILTHEIAKRWVKWGNSVTLFSSAFSSAVDNELIDNVRIIRKGHPDIRWVFLSVHFLAFWYYQFHKNEFDIVIDEIHGISFFTPWYIKQKKAVLICEVAGELWIKVFGFFFGNIGKKTEQLYIKYVYKNVLWLTISDSTKRDLIAYGVKEKNIMVLPMGITTPQEFSIQKKEKKITLIFVGRLSKQKGVEDAMIALGIVKKKISASLWIVGRGAKEYREYLEKLRRDLHLEKNIIFLDFVSEAKKFELMSRAHILIHPSIREGFGLTIPEAGFVGTPVVAYNVSGVRDIVKDMQNGILLKHNSPKMIAKAVFMLMGDRELYTQIQNKAKQDAKKYNWNNTARVALDALMQLKYEKE